MIRGNYNNKKVYAHRDVIACRLQIAGWPPDVAGDEIPVEIIGSTEMTGYWYYTAWAPLATGHKVLMNLPGWVLFENYQAAKADVLADEVRQAMYKHAACYHHHKKLTLWKRIKNLLAKNTSRTVLKSLPARPESTQGRGSFLPALPTLRRML